jgi:copper chaperone CopZ
MYELKVEDMTCGHCMSRVTQALKSVDPAAKLDIDLKTRQVRIESACELLELTDALAEAGYPAQPVSGKI